MKIWTTFLARTLAVLVLLASAGSILHSAGPGILIGSLVNAALGTVLSPSAGTPADVVTKGSPALVIGERTLQPKRWLRLLAADGSTGWKG
jgi:hypothetical protein